MSEEKDGGPAFPASDLHVNGVTIEYRGMTLRDYFAAAALTGLLSHYTLKVPSDQDTVAKAAYQLAGAMLAARVEKENP